MPAFSMVRFGRAALLGALTMLAFGVSGCGRKEAFPLESFLKSPADLEGNHYTLVANVDAQLKWTEGVGRFVAVTPTDQKTRLPIFIGDSLGANLIVAQRYQFNLTVRKGGLLFVNSLSKM